MGERVNGVVVRLAHRFTSFSRSTQYRRDLDVVCKVLIR